ncbi:hypothetical protein ABZ023_33380 [Streptomyces sp. NPDC006367]|uniref:hypothetical protein n=1 Tax=unclassified Streptomyces TaxID=2593676 RepID=UPI0033AFBED8
MSSQKSARLHIKITIVGTCAMILAGGLTGALLGGWGDAAVVGLIAGAMTALGSFVSRPRVIEALGKAADRGYADGLSHGVLTKVSQYEAAVFPMSPGGVTAEERFARRGAAYRVASAGELPHPVRETAATALAALDDRDPAAAQKAMTALFTAVHRQTTGR